MKYKVIILDRAKQNLVAPLSFLAQINKSAVQKLKSRLISEIRSLEGMPQRYPFFQADYPSPTARMIPRS